MDTGSRSWRAVLAAGDVLVLALFTVLGRISHDMEVADGTLWTTALPFAGAWLAAAALTGALGTGAFRGPGALVLRTTIAWAVACPLGAGLRAIILQRPLAPLFVVVAFILAWPLLVAWRVAFFRLAAGLRRSTGPSKRA